MAESENKIETVSDLIEWVEENVDDPENTIIRYGADGRLIRPNPSLWSGEPLVVEL